jgi:hypothetical protein
VKVVSKGLTALTIDVGIKEVRLMTTIEKRMRRSLRLNAQR